MKRSLYFLIVLCSTLTALAVQWLDPPLLSEFIEGKSFDLRLKLREKLHDHRARPDILMVLIDEQSLKEVGRWPWSRKVMARLVDRISAGRPKVIGLDIMFSEAEGAAADTALAQSLKRAGNVVLATAFTASRKGGVAGAALEAPDYLWEAAFMQVRGLEGIDWKKFAVSGEKVIPPLKELAVVSTLGHTTTIPDLDGTLRWDLLAVRYGDDFYPSLPLQLARIASGLSMEQLTLQGGSSVALGERIIPTDLSSRVIINYVGEEGSFAALSAADVLAGRVAPQRFRDAVVLVGTSALGTYDQKVSPLSGNMPGVEKNATVVQNLLDGDFIRKSPGVVEVVTILLTGLLLALVLPRLTAGQGVTFGFGLILVYTGAVCWFLIYRDVWISVVLPVGNMLVIMTIETITKLFAEERQAREIRKIFSSYVSPKIVEVLVENPQLARLGGQRREVTILFADIIGFTTLSEKLPPEEVVSLLNEYYKEMAEIIFRWDGTLDKFVGDEIMAVWGAPLEQPDHAELAVRCALNMSDRLEEMQMEWRQRGGDSVDCGIGLNTGEALVGNIGLEGKKMDYTVIGNHVNIAARVEKLTRQHGSRILITDNTLNAIQPVVERHGLGHVSMEERGEVMVKGKDIPVKIIAIHTVKQEQDGAATPR